MMASWCGARKTIWKSFLAESPKNGFEREIFKSSPSGRLLGFEEDTDTLICLLESMQMIQVNLVKTKKKDHKNQERAEA